MSSGQDKYSSPSGPPPTYGSHAHHDAGPYSPPQSAAPPNTSMTVYHDPRQPEQAYNQGYSSPAPQGAPVGGYYAPNNGPGYYGGPGPMQQGGPGGPYYGPPQQQMYYQQQPGMYGGPPPAGYYVDNRQRSGAGEGICAALLGTLACCCCLDLLF